MRIRELARQAAARGIALGKNPERTIRYYTSMGLLQRPHLEGAGRTKVANYTEDHLAVLELIESYKRQGLSLGEIRDLLDQPLYWSKSALDFMEPFIEAKGYPRDAFRQDAPATRRSIAVFLSHAADALAEGRISMNFLGTALTDKEGRPGIPSTH